MSCRIYNHIKGPKTKDKGTTNSNTTIVIDLNFIFKSTKKKNNTMNASETKNHVKYFVSFDSFFFKVVIWKAYKKPTKHVKTLSKLYIEKYIMMALDAHHEEKNKIKVNIFYNEANTAVFINLDFRGPFFLSFICYKTTN